MHSQGRCSVCQSVAPCLINLWKQCMRRLALAFTCNTFMRHDQQPCTAFWHCVDDGADCMLECNENPCSLSRKAKFLQVVALFQLKGTQNVAEIVGMVASASAMAYYIKRCIDTTGAPSDWPGPKAPVAGMVLVAFFALNICLQGLRS